jgi:N,N'-diacetyllegionaminate synthase
MKTPEPVAAIPFGRRAIGPGLPVVVIAEIGINHEGDPDACMQLVEAAARAGADAVKLQTVKAAENYAPGTESYELFRKAELADADTARAFKLARDLGLECFATCGDELSMDFVESLNPPAWKISSGLLTHLPLIRRAAATGRTLLLSTGMTGMIEARRAVDAARGAGAQFLGLFQCTSLYPAPPETLNLRAMESLTREFGAPVGFSDHSVGTMAATLAVACGAHMIEKHISLDPSRKGFDHPVSLDPGGFRGLVEAVRLAEVMLGTQDKTVPSLAKANAEKFLRCVAARHQIPAGKFIERGDVAVLRLSAGRQGLPPEAIDTIPGRRALRDIAAYQPIVAGDIS